MQVDINIQSSLTDDERYVFDVLRAVANEYAPSATPRVAGGWVRDKLTGQESDDIDVMVVGLSGAMFAELVTRHLGVKGPHVVRANPDASKHMETAGVSIPLPDGRKVEIDFAMARTEVYHEDSRIPEIKPATAREDAERRDLTINSMFYNIMTGRVEDFTGKGIKDLITDTIRTPLDPVTTFRDDPLRIFRAVRFAAKTGGKIDPETLAAMSDPQLREVIQKKISKERIQVELSKMLKLPGAAAGFQILKETGLWQDIIESALRGSEFEGQMSPLDMDQNNPNHQLSLWDHSMEVFRHTLEQFADNDEETRLVMALSAMMHDLGKLYAGIQRQQSSEHTTYKGHDEVSARIAGLILRFLKFENRVIDQVVGYISRHMYIHPLMQKGRDVKDKTLRRFVRKMGEESLSWLNLLGLAIADAKSRTTGMTDDDVQEYFALKERIEALTIQVDIPQGDRPSPVLNGHEIMNAVGIGPGPWMRDAVEFIADLQDENPLISKEEALRCVRERFAADGPGVPAGQSF